MKRLLLALCVSALTIGMFSSCAGPNGGLIVFAPSHPPQARVEIRPANPGPRYVWVPGRWRWNGNRWVWKNGHWKKRHGHHKVWVSGRWVKRPRGWVWKKGHWR